MTISCECDFGYDDHDWWFSSHMDFSPLGTKRSRKCCSCGTKIKPGGDTVEFTRWRSPNCDIEERIYGECGEVPLASWFMCEACGGLAMALDEAGACFTLGENIKDQIAEYRAAERGE